MFSLEVTRHFDAAHYSTEWDSARTVIRNVEKIEKEI